MRWSTKKKAAVFAAAVAAVAVLAAAGLVVMHYNAKSAYYYDYIQDIRTAAFYKYSFRMRAEADTTAHPLDLEMDQGFWATVFHRVEYVTEPPPDDERKWAVIYIWPGDDTEDRVLELNDIIKDDTGIRIDERLSLPLTVEQVLAYPDAVLEIIKQLDGEQWKRFYRYDSDIRKWNAKYFAWGAGIDDPTGE